MLTVAPGATILFLLESSLTPLVIGTTLPLRTIVPPIVFLAAAVFTPVALIPVPKVASLIASATIEIPMVARPMVLIAVIAMLVRHGN
jgi:hypothetical protein